ncbi:MAG: alpha-amylase family glycosyl hydrolase, partial [Verrucomicrobia bacterium]|nr:alpha-amylase family glycosyl hydrolase [Verrucomicrobiota bacterium]
MSWINKAVIYQINLRSLAMREPRNAIEAVGEKPNDESPLAYVTRHLGKIKRLGVNTLYLMPPYPSGQLGRKGIGSPYAIRDFKAVDPEYGTLDELKSFVRTAQAKRLRVILDLTPNHTSRDNVWVAAHPEYYFQNDDGELLWDFDWTDTAKLNYGHDDMRRAMTDVLDYWLGFLGTDAGGIPAGIDGYRLDMAHLISDLRYWNEAIAELRQRHNSRELLFLAESYGASNNLDLFGRGFNAAYDDDLYKCMVYGYGRDQDGESVISLSDEAPGNADFALMLAAYRQGGMAAAVAESLMRYEREL